MIIAVIPARGGSKRIPRKNLRLFAGKPIMAYSIEAARDARLFDRIVVSTDDAEIAANARACGAETPFTRPAELSDDFTGTHAVAAHALTALVDRADLDDTVACCLYPTAPFVTADDLRRGFDLLHRSGKSFVFAATTFAFPIQRALRALPDGGVAPFFPAMDRVPLAGSRNLVPRRRPVLLGTRAGVLRRVASIRQPRGGDDTAALPRHGHRHAGRLDAGRADVCRPRRHETQRIGAGVRIAIRADASVEIGSGHVARCASLAQRLREAGHEVAFLCRELAGNLADLLESEGFLIHRLEGDAHAWTEEDDARRCRDALGTAIHDWLIVDHYALGVCWERVMAAYASRILAIDDLGREHRCDLLLDQNYPNPTHERYRHGLPADRECLLGPRHALLRSEFAARRAASLARARERVARVLVFMGGSDPLDETSNALRGIAMMGSQPAVDVVIGAANPRRDAVAAACATLADATFHVQTQEMAALTARADCALGAPGSATWERCTLGLPAIVTILAENQAATGMAVDAAGAHRLLGRHGEVSAADYAYALRSLDAAALRGMSRAAAAICDGTGAQIVAAHLEAAAQRRSADAPQRRYA